MTTTKFFFFISGCPGISFYHLITSCRLRTR